MRNTHCAPRTRNQNRTQSRNNRRSAYYRSTVPSANVYREENAYTIELAVPGFSKSDISLEVDNHILTIKSLKEQASDELNYRFKEFDYASFERSFRLSKESDLENIGAQFKHGVLKITVQDLPVEPAKKITIK